jgi:hypothetical protein
VLNLAPVTAGVEGVLGFLVKSGVGVSGTRQC